jgi:hypothetical protein
MKGATDVEPLIFNALPDTACVLQELTSNTNAHQCKSCICRCHRLVRRTLNELPFDAGDIDGFI